MENSKVRSITNISNKLHDKVDEIYEGLMDEDVDETVRAIESIRVDLKDLKDNLTTKSKI